MKYQKNYFKFLKKIIFQNNKIIFFLILFLLVLLLFLKNNFIKNLINVVKFNEHERIEKVYGFCKNESVGYLRYLQKKYNIKTNPQIINFKHSASTKWSIYITSEKNNNSKQIILLNYPGKEIDVELFHYMDNFYELNDSYFYSDLFESIKKIKIKNLNEPTIRVGFYIKDESNKMIMVKDLRILKKNTNNDYILNQKFNDFKRNEKRFFLKFDNIKEKNKIIITLQNKYSLENYKILDKFNNCYFVE